VQSHYPALLKDLVTYRVTLVVEQAVKALKEVVRVAAIDTTPIYTELIAFAHQSDEDVAQRIRTLAKTVGVFGPQLCKCFTVPILTALSENRSPVIRSALAESLPMFASYTPLGKLEFIVGRLLVDEEASLDLLRISPQLLRFVGRSIKQLLADLLVKALDSFSKPLKHKAKTTLGPFISEYGPVVPQELIDRWLLLAEGGPWLGKACAKSFPGVLLNIGLEFWPLCSKEFLALSKHKSPEVKLEIAKSLKDVAHFIGKEQAGRDLSPIFVKYLKDPALAASTIEHAAIFMSGLSFQMRVAVTGKFIAQVYLLKDWRMAKAVASQFDAITNLLTADEGLTLLLPAALHLIDHEVATVREAAAPCIASLLILFNDDPIYSKVTEAFEGLATSKSWQKRILATSICSRLVENKEAFERAAVVVLAELSKTVRSKAMRIKLATVTL
jgi:hypothetical protein